MVRKFIRDVGKNFRKGDIRDYPKQNWDAIAQSAKAPLHKITEPVDTFANAKRDRR